MKKSLLWITTASLFLIPIFPLLVAKSFFFPFITGKAFYFRILVEIAFASWLILACFDAKYRPRFNQLTVTITLFTLIALLADVLGVNPVRSIYSNFERMEGWLAIIHLWAFYIVATSTFSASPSPKQLWYRWFNVSIVVATIVAIYGLVQLSGNAEIHQGSRVDASLGNAAYMAVYMLMHVALTAYMFFVARAKQILNAGFLQWLYPILSVVFAFVLFETATRGTTLGLFGGIMLACAIYAVCAKKEAKRSRWMAVGAIALVVVVGIVFWANRNSSFVKNHEVLNRLGSISWNNTSGQARQYIWPMAVKGALQRPVLGWGQENFNYIFNKDYNPKMWTQEQWFDRAHNVFLDWLVAAGIVGFLAYLALYVFLLISLWKSDLSIAQKSVLTGLVAGYAVHNIFVFDNLASYVFFFALLGFVNTLTHHHKTTSKIGLWIQNKTFSKDAVEYVAAPIVIVALAAGLYFLNVRAIQANTRLITALTACTNQSGKADPGLFAQALNVSPMANQEIREQLLSCTGNVIGGPYPGPTKQGFFDLVKQEIQAQIAWAPQDARMYVLGGMLMSNLNQIADATQLLEKAHVLTPRKQAVSIQLATTYIAAGKNDEAIALLKDAYESDPTYDDAKGAYIIGLIIVGREAEAHKLFDPSPVFETQRAARAYISIKKFDKAIAIFKKLIAADAQSVDLRVALAQTYYAAGMTWSAIDTMRALEKDHPEFKDQIEAAIKDIEKNPK